MQRARMPLRRRRIENQLTIFQHQLNRLHEDLEKLTIYLGRIEHTINPPKLPSFTPTKYVTRHTKLPGVNESNY